jgi:hypothetical protein
LFWRKWANARVLRRSKREKLRRLRNDLTQLFLVKARQVTPFILVEALRGCTSKNEGEQPRFLPFSRLFLSFFLHRFPINVDRIKYGLHLPSSIYSIHPIPIHTHSPDPSVSPDLRS